MSFLAEIKTRKLIQWGLAYLAGAWVALQVLGFLSDTYGWPASIVRIAPILLAGGLLIVLVLAWYHGATGRQRLVPFETGLLVIIVLITAGGAYAFNQRQPQLETAAVDDVVNPKSVAVLPFASLSADQENAYFASGMHDELLTQLAQLGDLKVISRTSVLAYKDTRKSLREVARELGVATIVEGSVQRSGNRVRVQAQLIDAKTDVHLWAERFDRDLTDVFAIQSEIAQRIANALNARLTASEQAALSKPPTDNPEAYDLYLRGRNAFLKPGALRSDLFGAIPLLERAINMDPDFAAARAMLSMVHGRIRWFGYDAAPIHLQRQKQEAEAALKLDPELADAHAAQAFYDYWGLRDYDRALAGFTTASRLAPGDAEYMAAIGYVKRRQGKVEEALAQFEKAIVLDPRNAEIRFDGTGSTYASLRRFAEAIREYDRGLVVAPDFYDIKILKGWAYFSMSGQLDTIRAIVEKTRPPADPYEIPAVNEFRVAMYMDRYDDALRVANSAPAVMVNQLVYVVRPLLAAHAHKARGDVTRARAAYDSARVLLERTDREQPNDWRIIVSLGHAYAGLGRTADAVRLARRSDELMPRSLDYWQWTDVAMQAAELFAQAGANDEALARISELMRSPTAFTKHELLANPLYDPLRGDPRFAALAK